MSGFMKTVSNFWQNVCTNLPARAGRVAFAVLEKAGGNPSRRVGAGSPVAWLQADANWGPQGPNARGLGWVTKIGTFVGQSAYFLCRIALASPTLQP